MSFKFVNTDNGLFIKDTNMTFFLISGVPGSGKSTMVNDLNNLGDSHLLAIDLDEYSYRDEKDIFTLDSYKLFEALNGLSDEKKKIVLCGINDDFLNTIKLLPFFCKFWIDCGVDKLKPRLQERIDSPEEHKWWANKYKGETINFRWFHANMMDKFAVKHMSFNTTKLTSLEYDDIFKLFDNDYKYHGQDLNYANKETY